jgi:hypothetical protein
VRLRTLPNNDSNAGHGPRIELNIAAMEYARPKRGTLRLLSAASTLLGSRVPILATEFSPTYAAASGRGLLVQENPDAISMPYFVSRRLDVVTRNASRRTNRTRCEMARIP